MIVAAPAALLTLAACAAFALRKRVTMVGQLSVATIILAFTLVSITPADTSVERGTSLPVLARFKGPLPPDVTLVIRPDAQEAKLGCLPLKKTKLSCDWRADAQILSHCWPEHFPESHLLQQRAAD